MAPTSHGSEPPRNAGRFITDAFIAQRCAFENLSPGDLEPIAKELIELVVSRGVPTRKRLLAFGLAVLATAAAVALSVDRPASTFVAVLAGVVAGFGVLLTSGLYVEWLLDGTYFRQTPSHDATVSQLVGPGKLTKVRMTAAGRWYWNCFYCEEESIQFPTREAAVSAAAQHPAHPEWVREGPHSRRATMGTLPGRGVEHIFCATDLVLGQPVYVSTWDQGQLWRRTSSRPFVDRLVVDGQSWDASQLRLAEVVRSSAAFPGIPPRRLVFFLGLSPRRPGRLRPLFDAGPIPPPPDMPGGWRDAYRDQPRVAFLADGGLWNNLGTQAANEDGILHGGSLNARPPLLLCINASATLTPSGTRSYEIPGLGILMSLLRGMKILNTNTVVPRVQEMMTAVDRRARHHNGPEASDPLALVVDLRSTSQMRRDIDWFVEYTEERRRPNANQSPAFLNFNTGAALRDFGRWEEIDALGDGDIAAPTTLGRINRDVALRLIARGYVNTFLMSWLTHPPSDPYSELEWLGGLRERLENLLPSKEPLVPDVR
jgi:hypothetical protein